MSSHCCEVLNDVSDVEIQSNYSMEEKNSQNCYQGTTLFCKSSNCELVKLVISSITISLLILVVFVGVSSRYSILSINPIINFVLLFFSLLLLAYVEALHYAVVAVEKWDMSVYEEEFPRAVKCRSLVDTPEKVKKFLVGRQFFVIFVVFLIAEITSFPHMPSNFGGMPEAILLVIKTGLPGVVLTLTLGQLIGQIYVEEYTVQFLNLYGCEFCIRLSLAAEYIGICNFSWLLYHATSHIWCGDVRNVQKTMTSSDNMLDDTPGSPTVLNRGVDFDNGVKNDPLTLFDVLKYIWSSIATLGSVGIICYGMSIRAYEFPVNPAGAFAIAVINLALLFHLEGLMIAIVQTQYWDPETFRNIYPRAFRLHQIINLPENVKRFIIGRQFCTVLTGFLLAQVFTFPTLVVPGMNPIVSFIIFKSGLVGVFVVLSFGQLLPELLAAEYPLRFMNKFGAYSIGYLSLLFDNFGIGHCAWSLYFLTRRLFCGKYINGEEEMNESSSKYSTRTVRVNSLEIIAGLQMSPYQEAKKDDCPI